MRELLRDAPEPARTHPHRARRRLRRLAAAASGIALALLAGSRGTQDAVANGDTRTLSIVHTHTKESATITFKRDGRYDRAALEQLNWLLRDWRANESTKMDPRLFDTVWEAYRSIGSSEAIHIVSAYRSPGTNSMLRRRSAGVAEFSQHMAGKAMDFYIPDVSVDQIRQVGMRMQRGGVGWYPRSGSPFVHLDVGSVRSWPRMTHEQLARLFPDGKTVHLPSDNRPLPGYEQARAEILSRGGTVTGQTQFAQADEDDGPSLKGFFAGLFGGGASEPPATAPTKARIKPRVLVASADPEDQTGTRAALAYAAPTASAALRGTLAARDAQSLLTAEPATMANQSAMPQPPRRPAEFAAIVAALAMPIPPARPVQVAGLAHAGMANLGAAHLESPRPAPGSAEARSQLRALFLTAALQASVEPASRAVPVRVALARVTTADAPAGLVAEPAGTVATRFSSRSPGDDLATARFSGSATERVPGAL